MLEVRNSILTWVSAISLWLVMVRDGCDSSTISGTPAHNASYDNLPSTDVRECENAAYFSGKNPMSPKSSTNLPHVISNRASRGLGRGDVGFCHRYLRCAEISP